MNIIHEEEIAVKELMSVFQGLPEIDNRALTHLIEENDPEYVCTIATVTALIIGVHRRINKQDVIIEKLRKALITAYGNDEI